MAALSFDALLRSLKKKGPRVPSSDPVYLLHGDEDVLKDEAIRLLVDAAVPEGGARDFNVDTRYAADLTPESFNALVNTPPMMAERRAVVIRGIEQLGKRKTGLRDELLRYLANPSRDTVLVLVVAAGEDPDREIADQATAVAAHRLEPERVPRWLQHRASALGITVAEDAADLLIAAVGDDLTTLSRELEKLGAHAAGAGVGRPVSADDVTNLVGVRRGETLHDLVQAGLERNVARAAALVEPVLEQAGMSGVKILSLLGTHLVGTAIARAERDRGTPVGRLPEVLFRQMLAARPYGLRGYKEEAANWTNWSALWTAPELRRALRAALAADNALKTATVSDDRGIVMQLVLGFVATARAAA